MAISINDSTRLVLVPISCKVYNTISSKKKLIQPSKFKKILSSADISDLIQMPKYEKLRMFHLPSLPECIQYVLGKRDLNVDNIKYPDPLPISVENRLQAPISGCVHPDGSDLIFDVKEIIPTDSMDKVKILGLIVYKPIIDATKDEVIHALGDALTQYGIPPKNIANIMGRNLITYARLITPLKS